MKSTFVQIYFASVVEYFQKFSLILLFSSCVLI